MAKTPEKIEASHILVMHKDSKDSRSSITKDEAKELIDKIHKQAAKKNDKFKDLAVEHSDCSSASYGGSLGEFGKGVMVKEFENTAFSLKVGELSQPIETDFGFHIIRRDA